MRRYYYISGLPRSGSTLLTAILNQNPNFYSDISDTLCACVDGTLANIYDKTAPVVIEENRIKNMILGLFDGFYSHIDKPFVFNTNRGWTGCVEYLYRLNSNFKIVCMVRDYNAILNSLEKNYKRRRLVDPVNTHMFADANANVWQRTHRAGTETFVKSSYDSLKEAYYGPYKKHLLLVEYNDLAGNPKETIKRIYNFIEQPYYEHDFENVSYSNEEYDSRLQAPGLHTVKGRVEPRDEEIVLPPEIWHRFKNMEFWRYHEQAK